MTMKTILNPKKLATLLFTCLIGTFISTVSISAPPSVSKYNSDKTLMLTLQYSNNNYKVIAAKILNEKLPARFTNQHSQDLLNFNLKNQHGDILGEGNIANPNILRGVLAEFDNGLAHSEKSLEKSTFIVRFPYVEGMQVLGLLDQVTQDQQGPTGRSLAPMPAVNNLGFSEFL